MAVRFLNQPQGQNLSSSPTERFDFSGLSMLAQRAREAQMIARERNTLRELMGEQPYPEEAGIGGGLKRVFGVGEQYQPLSQLEQMIAKAKISEKYPSPTDKLSLMVMENLTRQLGLGGAGGAGPTADIEPVGVGDVTQVGAGGPSAPTAPVADLKPSEPKPSQFIRVKTGELDTRGLPKYEVKKNPAYELWEKKQESGLGAIKETIAQEKKKAAEGQRLAKTAFAKMDTMFTSWLDTVARTYEITGVKPGPQQAPLTAILGKTKINQFQEAFKGAEPEYAAAIGRMAVPGARSVRLIDLFKKGAPSAWSSIPSGVINSARSARMQFAGYLATAEGSKALGVPYDPINPIGWRNAANQALEKFESLYRDGLYEMIYFRQPALLPQDIKTKFDTELQSELKRRTNGRL